MSSVEIPAEEWDLVPATTEARTKYLQSKGVPIDDEGKYLPNFDSMAYVLKDGQMTWAYYWHD